MISKANSDVLRCDLCTILIGEDHIFKHPVRIKISNRFYNVDEGCFKFLKKLSKPRARKRIKSSQNARYMI